MVKRCSHLFFTAISSLQLISGRYRLILDTDELSFGGHGRLVAGQVHFTHAGEAHELSLYLPSRTAQVLIKED